MVVAEGNRTLASFPASSFSPSPLLLVKAEKGAQVLLMLNYVSFWDEASLWAQRAGAAERAFALSFPFSFVPLAVAAVEWRRTLMGMKWAVSALGANLAAPFAVAAVGLLLAAAVAYSLSDVWLADSVSVYAYLALVAAVVAAAIDERRKGRKSDGEGDEEREVRGGGRHPSSGRKVCRCEDEAWLSLKCSGLDHDPCGCCTSCSRCSSTA